MPSEPGWRAPGRLRLAVHAGSSARSGTPLLGGVGKAGKQGPVRNGISEPACQHPRPRASWSARAILGLVAPAFHVTLARLESSLGCPGSCAWCASLRVPGVLCTPARRLPLAPCTNRLGYFRPARSYDGKWLACAHSMV